MRLKSYFSNSVESALSKAQQELGEDAVLVQSRKTAIEARHLGAYEVVCAEISTAPANVPRPPSLQLAAPAEPVDRLSEQVREIKKQMEMLSSRVYLAGTASSGAGAGPEWLQCFQLLIAAEVDTELAHELATRAIERAESRPWQEQLRSEIRDRARTDARLGKANTSRRIVAFVGTPGAGKTSLLVKLVAQHRRTFRKPVQIISCDTLRIAAIDQMQAYAAILGVGFQAAESASALEQAVEENRHKDLIAIDLPGLGAKDMDDANGLAVYLARAAEQIDTHLVMSASMKSGALRRTVDRFALFKPSKLAFTRLDETEAFGSLLSLSVRANLPISFLANGQEVPEDLESATPDRVAELILSGEGAGIAVTKKGAAA